MKIDYQELGPEEIQQSLREFEERFAMTSDVFARKYLAGELPEDEDHVLWIGLWRMYSAAKKRMPA